MRVATIREWYRRNFRPTPEEERANLERLERRGAILGADPMSCAPNSISFAVDENPKSDPTPHGGMDHRPCPCSVGALISIAPVRPEHEFGTPPPRCGAHFC
jgi:hypothetical protein